MGSEVKRKSVSHWEWRVSWSWRRRDERVGGLLGLGLSIAMGVVVEDGARQGDRGSSREGELELKAVMVARILMETLGKNRSV